MLLRAATAATELVPRDWSAFGMKYDIEGEGEAGVERSAAGQRRGLR